MRLMQHATIRHGECSIFDPVGRELVEHQHQGLDQIRLHRESPAVDLDARAKRFEFRESNVFQICTAPIVPQNEVVRASACMQSLLCHLADLEPTRSRL
jgi:hypothetical protein